MDYEKAYKDALSRAKDCHVNKKFSELDDNAQQLCEYIFPELKESDEMIRKELINFIKKEASSATLNANRLKFKSMLAWLEKQGEPQTYKGDSDAMRKNLIKAFKTIGTNNWGWCGLYVKDILHFLESKDAVELENRGEQNTAEFDDTNAKRMFIKALERVEEQNAKGYKLTDCDKNSWWEDFKNYTSCTIKQKPTNKIEPRFKVGDWVVENKPNNYARFIQILEIVNVQGKDGYRISRDIHNNEDIVGLDFVEKYYHKFDIKDARMVIEQNPAWSEEDELMFTSTINSLKLTNGACDMKIDWLKQLKNRVQPQQKQEWSDDDEMGYNGSLWAIKQARTIAKNENDMGDLWYAERWLKSIKDRVQSQPKQEWSEEDEIMINDIILDIQYTSGSCERNIISDKKIAWLKSLKPQSHWKPTDEQIHCFKCVIDFYKTKVNDTIVLNLLNSLYNNLLKL